MTNKYFSAMHASQQDEGLAVAVCEEGVFLFKNPEQGQASPQEDSRMDVVACPQALYEPAACLALQPAPSPPPASLEDSYKLLGQASCSILHSADQENQSFQFKCNTFGHCGLMYADCA